jgi:DNA transposition AAA+ family ATPase
MNTPERTSSHGSLNLSAQNFEVALSKYDPDSADVLRFWFFTARERGWSLPKLQEATGISTSTLSRVLRNIYEGDTPGIIEKLRRARENFVEAVSNPDFIETSLSRQMYTIFDKTRALGNVSILWGKMGIGKTTIIREYQRLNNHGRTIAIRFPAGSSFSIFLKQIAKSCGLSPNGKNHFELRVLIIKILGAGKRLLIVDELHQAFLTCSPEVAVRCCELLREIADEAECGMVLIGTEALEESILHGQYKEALAQLVDRGTVQVPLPAKPTRKDIESFVGHYGLTVPGKDDTTGAKAIIDDIIIHSGLRKLTMHLRDGAAYANKREESYTWPHFVAAFEAIQSLGKH